MNNITNHFNIKSFITFIFILFPISFVVGPALIETLNFILILFLFKKLFEDTKFIKIFHNKILILILLFNLVILISSLNSDYVQSIKYPLTFFRYILFSISCYLILTLYPVLIKQITFVIIILFIILFFGSLYEYMFKQHCGYFNSGNAFIIEEEFCLKIKDFFVGSFSRPDRHSSFFGDELILGSFISRLLPLLIGLIFFSYSKFKFPKILIYFLILLSFFTVLLSGERAALIYYLFFIFIFFCVVNEKLIYKVYFLFFLFFILIISFNSFKQINVRMIESYSQIKLSLEKKIFFSTDHHNHALAAYKIFLDYKILGSGPNTFRYICKKEKYHLKKPDIKFGVDGTPDVAPINSTGCSTHPHNLYLQLLSETGVVGIIIPLLFQIFLLIILIKSIFKIQKFRDDNRLRCEIFLISAFFISLFPLIPSGNFFNNWLSFIYFYPLGFYLYIKNA